MAMFCLHSGEHQMELLDCVAAKFHEEPGVFKLLVCRPSVLHCIGDTLVQSPSSPQLAKYLHEVINIHSYLQVKEFSSGSWALSVAAP